MRILTAKNVKYGFEKLTDVPGTKPAQAARPLSEKWTLDELLKGGIK